MKKIVCSATLVALTNLQKIKKHLNKKIEGIGCRRQESHTCKRNKQINYILRPGQSAE